MTPTDDDLRALAREVQDDLSTTAGELAHQATTDDAGTAEALRDMGYNNLADK